MALGTIADMVHLSGRTGSSVKPALILMAGHRPGLTALLEASAIHDRILNADDIAFRLAPRLNAAGRMERPWDLLNAQDTEAAKAAAQTLNLLNRKRQDLERGILADIQRFIDNNRRCSAGDPWFCIGGDSVSGYSEL